MKKKILSILVMPLLLISCNSNITSTSNSYTLTVAVPKGAPAIAQSLISYNIDNKANILDGAPNIKAALTAGNYDLIYAPSNLGCQVYNANQSYTMLAGITFGNLYFASTSSINSVSDLNNKNIILFGKGSINDLVSKYIIEQNNIEANISYLDSANDTKTMFVANQDKDAIYLLADPQASAAKIALNSKGINSSLLSVEELIKSKTGFDGFSQASLFVKKSTYIEHKELVEDYLNKLENSISYINNLDNISNTTKMLKELEYFDLPEKVLQSAIPGCNIKYVKASELKEMFEATYNLNLALIGGKLPDEGFYQI